MKLSFAKALVFATAGTTAAFLPIHRASIPKAGSAVPLKGVFYLDDVYLPGTTANGESSSSEGPVPAMAPPSEISKSQVRALFYLWNDALSTGDPRIVAKRYSEEPLLLLAGSDDPISDHDAIVEYFDRLLKLRPQGVILNGNVRIGNGWAHDAGIYELTFDANDGSDYKKIRARYTFIYNYDDHGQWKIAHHHSSLMPEETKRRGPINVTGDQIKNLFVLWNDALDMMDSNAVSNRYTENAVLIPSSSGPFCMDRDSIQNYYDDFLQSRPQCRVLESHVAVGDGWARDTGIYEFTMGSDGSKVKAQYVFVYVHDGQCWKISLHQSTALSSSDETPKSDPVESTISEDEVRNLFSLWNDALATLDPDTVARRYASNAVYLPTVSDTPRTDYESIKAYFDGFLQKKPQCTVLESFVTIGNGWCKDVGIYEFTMGSDGIKIKARYSFIYVYDKSTDEWKILHHHSSVMPEAFLYNNQKPVAEEEPAPEETVVETPEATIEEAPVEVVEETEEEALEEIVEETVEEALEEGPADEPANQADKQSPRERIPTRVVGQAARAEPEAIRPSVVRPVQRFPNFDLRGDY